MKAKLDEVMEKLDFLMLSCFSPEKKPGVEGLIHICFSLLLLLCNRNNANKRKRQKLV